MKTTLTVMSPVCESSRNKGDDQGEEHAFMRREPTSTPPGHHGERPHNEKKTAAILRTKAARKHSSSGDTRSLYDYLTSYHHQNGEFIDPVGPNDHPEESGGLGPMA